MMAKAIAARPIMKMSVTRGTQPAWMEKAIKHAADAGTT